MLNVTEIIIIVFNALRRFKWHNPHYYEFCFFLYDIYSNASVNDEQGKNQIEQWWKRCENCYKTNVREPKYRENWFFTWKPSPSKFRPPSVASLATMVPYSPSPWKTPIDFVNINYIIRFAIRGKLINSTFVRLLQTTISERASCRTERRTTTGRQPARRHRRPNPGACAITRPRNCNWSCKKSGTSRTTCESNRTTRKWWTTGSTRRWSWTGSVWLCSHFSRWSPPSPYCIQRRT